MSTLRRGASIIQPTLPSLARFLELPDHLWIHIFEQLSRPSDRYHIVQTCRSFYHLGLRALYTDLTFRKISHFSHNALSCTSSDTHGREDNMTSAPRSVTVYGSFMSSKEILDFLRRDTVSPFFEELLHRPPLLPNSFMKLLSSFVNLRIMSFDGIPIPYSFYDFISQFPHLRELAITNCTLPRRPAIFRDTSARAGNDLTIHPTSQTNPFEDLPITSLRLTSNRWYVNRTAAMFSIVGRVAASHDTDYFNFLHLATARNLRELHVDWDTQTAIFFSALARGRVIDLGTGTADDGGENGKPNTWILPRGIQILRLATRTEPEWLRLPRQSRRELCKSLNVLLKSLRGSLRELTIDGHVPALEPRMRVKMWALERYCGPMEFLRSVWCVGGRAGLGPGAGVSAGTGGGLKSISVSEQGGIRWSEFRDLVAIDGSTTGRGRIPNAAGLAEMRSLEVEVLAWDDRLLLDVRSIFRGLRELRVNVGFGYASEETLEQLGERIFAHLPRLKVFQLLASAQRFLPSTPPSPSSSNSPSSSPTSTTDNRILSYLSLWHPYIPNMREIRLCRDSVWRRAGRGDAWCKRTLDVPAPPSRNSTSAPSESDAFSSFDAPVPDMVVPGPFRTQHHDALDHGTWAAQTAIPIEMIGEHQSFESINRRDGGVTLWWERINELLARFDDVD